MRKLIFTLSFFLLAFFAAPLSHAQELDLSGTPTASPSGTEDASESAKADTEEKKLVEEDVTKPEEEPKRQEVLNKLFENRRADQLTATNFAPYAIQFAVRAGVPANTVTLILLIPVLATIIVAFRYLIGLSGIGLLVPIALSITLLATDVTPGFIMLGTILIASLVARFIMKRIHIMQMPKVALSMLMVVIFLLTALTFSSLYGVIDVRNLSFFPVLLLIILSDRIVTLFMEREIQETIQTTVITLFLGILGFLLLSWEALRTYVLLYPEVILLLIPINLMIGRYFGLRMTEYIKFQPILKHGSK